MRAAAFNNDIVADNDPVEFRYRAVAVETGRGLYQPMVVEGEFRKRATIRPLVEIAHQHSGQVMGCAVKTGQQRADLPPPPKPRQIKMRADNAQWNAVEHQFGKYGTAWFECWQRHDLAMPDLYSPLHQQGIAVPADTLRSPADFNGSIHALFEQQMVGDGAKAVSEAPVCFLQRDDVGIDFTQYL